MNYGVKLSSKETRSLSQLLAMSGVRIPAFKPNKNYYQLPIEELLNLQSEATTYYLDTASGDDSNSGLSRSAPKQSVAAVVRLARSLNGGDAASTYDTRQCRLVILGSAQDSGEGLPQFTVNIDSTEWRDYETGGEPGMNLDFPFQVVICEDRRSNLYIINNSRIGTDYIFIDCKGDVTLTNGSLLSGANGCYIKAKDISIESGGTVSMGGPIVCDSSGTITVVYGGGFATGAGVYLKAKNISLSTGFTLGNGGPLYLEALNDLSVFQGPDLSYSGPGVIKAGNNISLSYIGQVSTGTASSCTIEAGNDVEIFSTGGFVSRGRNSVSAGGTVKISESVAPYGINIKAKCITDFVSETVNGLDTMSVTENSLSVWEAEDTISIFNSKFCSPSLGSAVKFKARKLEVAGTLFNSGDMTIDTDRLYVAGTLGNEGYTMFTSLTVKTGILDLEASGQIAVNAPPSEGNVPVRLVMDQCPSAGSILITGYANAEVEMDKLNSGLTLDLAQDNAIETGSKRVLIERLGSEILTYYLDTVNGNDNFDGLNRNSPKKSLSHLGELALASERENLRLVILNHDDSLTLQYDASQFNSVRYPFTYTEVECPITFDVVGATFSTFSGGSFYAKSFEFRSKIAKISLSRPTFTSSLKNLILNSYETVIFRPIGGNEVTNIFVNAINYIQVCVGDEDTFAFGDIALTCATGIVDVLATYEDYYGEHERVDLECRFMNIRSNGNVCIRDVVLIGALYVEALSFKDCYDTLNPSGTGLEIRGYWTDAESFCVLNIKEKVFLYNTLITGQTYDLYAAHINCDTLEIVGSIYFRNCILNIDASSILIRNIIGHSAQSESWGASANLYIRANKIVGTNPYSRGYISLTDYAVLSGGVYSSESISNLGIFANTMENISVSADGPRLNALVEVGRETGCQISLNPDDAMEGCYRKFIERSKNIGPYDAVIQNRMLTGYVGGGGNNPADVEELKAALEATNVESIYISSPYLNFNQSVTLGCNKKIYGEPFKFSSKISCNGKSLKVFSDIEALGPAEIDGRIYLRRLLGTLKVTDGEAIYEDLRTLVGSITLEGTATTSHRIWAESNSSLRKLQDVDDTGLANGSSLVYDSLSEKFKPSPAIKSITAEGFIEDTECTLNIEQGGFCKTSLSDETALTTLNLVLLNSDDVDNPIWNIKVLVGSNVSLTVKIGESLVGWIGTEVETVAAGETVEVNVFDGMAVGVVYE